MIEKIQNLIHALRDELQQYGEMLALLDQHQELVMRRATDELLPSVEDIQAQGAVIQEVRRRRAECQRLVSHELHLADGATFADLVPLLPEDYRPLLGALVQENNELLTRVQQRSRQNHLLLARTLEMMQRFMSTLFPGSASPVYNEMGSVLGRAVSMHSLYEAVG